MSASGLSWLVDTTKVQALQLFALNMTTSGLPFNSLPSDPCTQRLYSEHTKLSSWRERIPQITVNDFLVQSGPVQLLYLVRCKRKSQMSTNLLKDQMIHEVLGCCCYTLLLWLYFGRTARTQTQGHSSHCPVSDSLYQLHPTLCTVVQHWRLRLWSLNAQKWIRPQECINASNSGYETIPVLVLIYLRYTQRLCLHSAPTVEICDLVQFNLKEIAFEVYKIKAEPK